MRINLGAFRGPNPLIKALLYSFAWAMEACWRDNEERAVVASNMNGLTYAAVAWLPILIFPQTMAPTFHGSASFRIFWFLYSV